MVRLSDGSVLQGPVHPSWKSCDVDPLVSTVDLHAAYMQAVCQHEVLVDEQLKAELKMLGERVRHERPRLVPPLTKQQPILVFTDGASEESLHVVGGFIFFPGDDPPRFLGNT